MKYQAAGQDWERYLVHLRQLPFVDKVVVREVQPRNWAQGRGAIPGHERPDAILTVRTARGDHEFFVELKRTHLTYAIADGVTVRAQRAGQGPSILFALYVPRRMGRYLGEHGVNYVDLAGNCRLTIGADFAAVIEGQTPTRIPAHGRGTGLPGYRVLFAVLVKPELLNAPVRTLAEAAAVGKTTVAETLARLEEDGLIGKGTRQRRLIDARALLDRWIVGYETVVRPRQLLGRFRTQDPDPAALEKRIEKELGEKLAWAWGGGAAAMRMTRHYRGEETIIHVADPTIDFPKRLRALPAADGPLVIQRTPASIAFEGILPRTVHPLLVFAELMVSGNPRAREAALEVRQRYLRI